MRMPEDLTREELERAVGAAQEACWGVVREGQDDGWDPDKEWDWDDFEWLAGVLEGLGLKPEQKEQRSVAKEQKPKKNWYHVVGAVSGSKYLGRFLASSAEEAVEMALDSDAAYVSLCHHCSGQCEDPEILRAEASPDPNQSDEGTT